MAIRPSRHAVERLVSAVLDWGVLFLLWLMYVGEGSKSEMITGALAGALAAVASESVRGHNLARFYPATHWIYVLGRLPAAVLRDCGRLTRLLVRRFVRGEPPPATFDEIDFQSGGDDARSAARRALAVSALSLPPNSYVIGVDRGRNRLLLHTLMPNRDAETMAIALARHGGSRA